MKINNFFLCIKHVSDIKGLTLTLKVLNFWKFTCYCKILMVWHGGSSASSYLADLTSPIPSHCASIVATSTLRVNSNWDTCIWQYTIAKMAKEQNNNPCLYYHSCWGYYIWYICQLRFLQHTNPSPSSILSWLVQYKLHWGTSFGPNVWVKI